MSLKQSLSLLFISLFILSCGCFGMNDGVPSGVDEAPISQVSAGEEEFIEDPDYRQEMRELVIDISTYSKQKNPDFIVIPQNGQELLIETVDAHQVSEEYLAAIDGVGREDLFFGYENDNEVTPNENTDEMLALLDMAKENGISVLVTDYCWDKTFVDSSYQNSAARGYISFAADSRGLDSIPSYPAVPFAVNSGDVLSLSDIGNFLYIIDPGNFDERGDFLKSLQETDYDLLIIDMFYDDISLTVDELSMLKTKSNGGSRLVVAYMSIGEAEDYRYYWSDSWERTPPSWLEAENPDWEGNYKVLYWGEGWQSVIYGSEDAYLDKVIDAGFDGVYLDIIDAFEYFEGV
ncbi:endo alpha-1,4 polygalactosaminidase [Methanolobus sp. ZRKC3]|uniref:endo alpha-1,4 polygalactosaminidase n=1 Tax=Methanolobus sp. ZRKC3 TaxID=3125786 RepID=UPI00324ABB7D